MGGEAEQEAREKEARERRTLDPRPSLFEPYDARSWWERTFGKKEIIRWPVSPLFGFVSVITAVAVGAALITAGVQIGERKGTPPLISPASPRTDSPQLKALTKQVETLTRVLTERKPQQFKVELAMPKDSIKIALPPAPEPQTIHVHTKEIRTKESERVVEKAVPVQPEKQTPAFETKKKAPEDDTTAGQELPPPLGTERRRIWDAKHASKGVKDGTATAGGRQTP